MGTNGFMKMRGNPTSLDIQVLFWQQQVMYKHQRQRFKEMGESIATLRSNAAAASEPSETASLSLRDQAQAAAEVDKLVIRVDSVSPMYYNEKATRNVWHYQDPLPLM